MENFQSQFLSVDKKLRVDKKTESKKEHECVLNVMKDIVTKEKIKYTKKEEFLLAYYGLLLNDFCS
jgi:hypothetical protein